MSDRLVGKKELRKLVDIMDDCLHAQTEDDVRHVVDVLGEVIPFNAAILCRQSLTEGEGDFRERMNHSYPDEWVDDYFSHRLFEQDPVVQMGKTSGRAYSWETAIRSVPVQETTREFLDLASDFGLQEGVAGCCGLGSKAAVKTLISLETTGCPVDEEYLATVELVLPHLHASLERIDETGDVSEAPAALTERELETLKWVQEGKTAWEIGMILSISERTVRFHLKNIYRKLDVTNRSQAVVKAMRCGLV